VARYDRSIPPGVEGKITLELKTKGYQGKVHKTATVKTNDPKRSRVIIGLTGTVWVPIAVNPRYGHLAGVVGDAVEKMISLEAKKKEPLKLELATVSIPDKIDVELKEEEKGRTYQVLVKNKVKGIASYNGEITFKTNYPEKPELKIRVRGSIRPAVEARPRKLNFGRVSQKQIDRIVKDGRPMTRPVMVIMNKGADLKVTKVQMGKSLFKTTSKPMQNGRMIQVVVEVDFNKLKKGVNEDLLEIHTNQKGAEILKVPVLFELL